MLTYPAADSPWLCFARHPSLRLRRKEGFSFFVILSSNERYFLVCSCPLFGLPEKGPSSEAPLRLSHPLSQIISVYLIYINSLVPDQRKPGCSVKEKKGRKTNRLVCIYLTINKLILFKVSKTAQNSTGIC